MPQCFVDVVSKFSLPSSCCHCFLSSAFEPASFSSNVSSNKDLSAASVGAHPICAGGGGRQPDQPRRVQAAALKSKYVLVMEPTRDGGKCVTARKGWGRFDMTITGRAPDRRGLAIFEKEQQPTGASGLHRKLARVDGEGCGRTFNLYSIWAIPNTHTKHPSICN
jgi:hypothetical protein